MTAENAIGLFALASLVVSGGAYLLLARTWDFWPFRAAEESDDACLGCGAVIESGSFKHTCGSLECDSWSRTPMDKVRDEG